MSSMNYENQDCGEQKRTDREMKEIVIYLRSDVKGIYVCMYVYTYIYIHTHNFFLFIVTEKIEAVSND